jgi:hypothetical protein
MTLLLNWRFHSVQTAGGVPANALNGKTNMAELSSASDKLHLFSEVIPYCLYPYTQRPSQGQV